MCALCAVLRHGEGYNQIVDCYEESTGFIECQASDSCKLFIHALYYACVTTASSDSFDLRLDAIELCDEVDLLARLAHGCSLAVGVHFNPWDGLHLSWY